MTACTELERGQLVIRPMSSDDGERLIRFHEDLDDYSQYLRFFTAHPHLSPAEVERFTHVDHADREALVVIENNDIVGVGRYDRLDSGDSAEVAFVVAQRWRAHGLATTLLHELVRRARQRGITTFVAETLSCNSGMRAVFTHAGYPTRSTFADGVAHTTMDIRSDPRGGA